MGIVTIKPNKHKTGFVYDRREQFLIDAEEDLVLLTKNAVAGSTAWLADCSKKYVLNSASEWVEENVGSGSVSGGSAGGGLLPDYVINMTFNEDEENPGFIADKTLDELSDAATAFPPTYGRCIIQLDGMQFEAAQSSFSRDDDGKEHLSVMVFNTPLRVYVDSDGSIEFLTDILEWRRDGNIVVEYGASVASGSHRIEENTTPVVTPN